MFRLNFLYISCAVITFAFAISAQETYFYFQHGIKKDAKILESENFDGFRGISTKKSRYVRLELLIQHNNNEYVVKHTMNLDARDSPRKGDIIKVLFIPYEPNKTTLDDYNIWYDTLWSFIVLMVISIVTIRESRKH